jgi:basic amino acid/polyamine antiporter, APA family
MAGRDANTESSGTGTLERRLTAFDCVMIVAGAVIGVGIFVNPSEVARHLRSPSAILLAWVMGGILAMLGAIACSKLGRWMPRAGGLYVYLREAYHPGVAFLYGWTVLFAVFSGITAAVSLTFARYAAVLVPPLAPFEKGVASLLVAVLAAVNYGGVVLSRTVQNFFTLAKICALTLLIAAALRTTQFQAVIAPPEAPDTSTFLFSLLPVLMSYGGWYTLTFLAADIKRPDQALPIGIIGGLSIVIVIYTLINAAYLRVMTAAEVADSRAVAAAMAERVFGAAGANVIASLVIVSAPAVVNVLILAGSRLYFAMAKDGLFFASAARLHPRHGSPVFAIVVQAGWSITLILSQTYGQLLQDAMFAEWTFFALTGLSVFVLAAREPSFYQDAKERIVTSAAAALFTVIASAVVVNTLYRSFRQSLLGVLLILAGVPVFFLWRRRASI